MNIKLLATSLAATALIGCGGSSSSPTPTETPTPTPEVTPTPTPEVTPTPTPEVTPTPTPVEETNLVAQITDTDGGDGADTGELRIRLSSALPEGKIEFRVNKNFSLEELDGFINLSGTSTNRDEAIIDLRMTDTGYSFTEATVEADFPEYVIDTWADLEITWDASSASDTVAPLITMTIDDQEVTDAAFPSESLDLTAVAGGLQNIQFRFGGGSASDDIGAYLLVDDIKVYSDTAGNTEVCSITFEDDEVDSVLNESEENAAFSPCPLASVTSVTFTYHENSFQATVQEEE